VGVTQRLRELDNRVLKLDAQQAKIRTEAGWREMAAGWRWMSVVAGLLLLFSLVTASFGYGNFGAFGVAGGVLAFRAGQLKAEDDRLYGRGFLNRARPPGV
jgi:hypothetical protein